MSRPRPAVITLITSLVLLASVPVVVARAWPAQREDATVTFDRRGVLPGGSPDDPVAQAAGSSTAESSDVAAGSDWPRTLDGVTASPPPVDRPTELRIPRLGIDAPIRSVGVDPANAVLVPRDIHTVGWYRLGAAPGTRAGSAVIVGHRDGADGSDGAFAPLGRLIAGDRIDVTTDAGARLSYEVRALQLIPRDEFAGRAPELFRTDGSPRLALVTCGGDYDAGRGGYQANIVILADPLPSA